MAEGEGRIRLYGISYKNAVFLLIVNLLVIFLYGRHTIVKIHKIHTAAAVHVIGNRLAAQNTEGQSVIYGNTSGCDIAEQLIAKSLSA